MKIKELEKKKEKIKLHLVISLIVFSLGAFPSVYEILSKTVQQPVSFSVSSHIVGGMLMAMGFFMTIVKFMQYTSIELEDIRSK
tara:strand:+ start:475 stop:726 length:252 start_codon:yes stop_codon:yes gene_type:complete